MVEACLTPGGSTGRISAVPEAWPPARGLPGKHRSTPIHTVTERSGDPATDSEPLGLTGPITKGHWMHNVDHPLTRVAEQPQWIDRLVELQVLADNGDTEAAAAAASWIAEDTEARKVWEDVQRVCDQVRNGGPES